MTIEDSKEIEKIFYQDSFGKKKVGSNVHRMTGKGKRGGIKGGVRFTNTFKKYERRSSSVRLNNLYETILPFNEFNTYSEEMQFEMLDEWVIRYSKEKIKNDMGISYNKLEKLLHTLNVDLERNIVRANTNDMKRFKEDGISVSQFKLLPDDQKYEVVDFWQRERGMTNKNIAANLGYATNTFNTKKSQWKKIYEGMEGEQNNVAEYKDDFLLEGTETIKEDRKNEDKGKGKDLVQQMVDIQEREGKHNKSKDEFNFSFELDESSESSESFDSQETSFHMNLQGVYDAEELREKFKALTSLLDSNELYEVSIKIKEHDE